MKLGILKGTHRHYRYYVEVCEELGVDYEIIDILMPDWIDTVKKNGCDGFLCRPPNDIPERKSMYDEKIYFINKIMKKPIYPSFDELFLYENKRNVYSWLALHEIPHPRTWIFGKKKDVLEFIKCSHYPLVSKSNIGSSASGVNILESERKAKKVVKRAFGRFHPNLTIGHFQYKKAAGIPVPQFGRAQKQYVIFQEYHPIRWEWRVIKIGPSYFGHQKLLSGRFASGSKRVGWEVPPQELLYTVKNICDIGGFYSMAVDILETEDGEYLVNELQSLFGSKGGTLNLPYQMKLNGVPGRYIFQNDEFIFEAGEFNRHGSYLLRVSHFIDILKDLKSDAERNPRG